jgi:23S rRNA pseudouridine955/2504/2580 synthase
VLRKKKAGNPLERVLFEGSDFLVINKVPGISCLADRSGDPDISSFLKKEGKGFQLCHRLDKYTSGVLLISKNTGAYTHATQLFESRQVHKLYHAIVEGRFPQGETVIEEPLEISGKGKARTSKKGKEAITLINLLKGFRDYSVLNCMPVTGRFHQIRAHLSFLGFPIAGDLSYGGNEILLSSLKRNYKFNRSKKEAALMERTALHAFKIRLKDLEGKEIEVEAPYSEDFVLFQKMLKKHNE